MVIVLACLLIIFLIGYIIFESASIGVWDEGREFDKIPDYKEEWFRENDSLRQPLTKPKNDETYVSFEELLGEKPKRKNDEKEKWNSLPHYVVHPDGKPITPPYDGINSRADWDAYTHYLMTGNVRFQFRGKDAELSSFLSMDELEQMGITAEDLPSWYRTRVRR